MSETTIAPAAPQDWNGDKQLQREIAGKIIKRYRRTPPVDLAGACQTVIVNLVLPLAKSPEDAHHAIDQHANDLHETVRRHYLLRS